MVILPLVHLVEGLDRDAAQKLPGEDAQQGPGQVQGVEDGPVLVSALGHKLLLKFLNSQGRYKGLGQGGGGR